jgi:DNA-binding beta-propeller fold protein YncE
VYGDANISGNITSGTYSSNNIGGVVLSNASISNASTTSNAIGGVVLSNGILVLSNAIYVQQIQEVVVTAASPGTFYSANWSSSAIFYMTGLTGNISVSIANIPSITNRSYNVSFFLVQGATPYIINSIVLPTAVSSAVLAGATSGFADGTGVAALFSNSGGVCIDSTGSNLYVADTSNRRIRKIVTSTGVVTTLAGSGASGGTNNATGTSATFSSPMGICINPVGTFLYVVDYGNQVVRSISLTSPYAVAAVAGSNTDIMFGSTVDGTGAAARFNQPLGICIDPAGTNLYVSEGGNGGIIRKIVVSSTVVTTIAGSNSLYSGDGIGTAAGFNKPAELCTDLTGSNLYVADTTNNLIRKIVLATNTVTTVAGGGSGFPDSNGIGTSAKFSSPYGLRLDSFGNAYILEKTSTGMIRKLDTTGMVSTISSNTSSYPYPSSICSDAYGTKLYVADTGSSVIRTTTIASNVTIKWPSGVIIAGTGNRTEIQSFSIYNSGSTWITLSQLSSFA